MIVLQHVIELLIFIVVLSVIHWYFAHRKRYGKELTSVIPSLLPDADKPYIVKFRDAELYAGDDLSEAKEIRKKFRLQGHQAVLYEKGKLRG